MMNRSEEFLLTLQSNASTKYYPNNKPNSYKVLLPATPDLEGTWDVAIVNIQYPFNWPNFKEEFVAFMVSVKESEASFTRELNFVGHPFHLTKNS